MSVLEFQDEKLVEMVAQARAMAPRMRERRRETDELRRLPDQNVAEIDELGIIGVGIPGDLGGADVGPEGIFALSYELAKGCAASGWCAGNWAVHSILLAAFPQQAQEECFAGSRLPRMSTGFSPLRSKASKADGGMVISGSWDFASGVDHADWMVVVALGEQGPLAFLLPTSELEIVDTWQTSGLRGTGSKDVASDGVFVPDHRIVSLSAVSDAQSPGREVRDMPFLRVPLGAVFGSGVIGTILGAAAGGLDEFERRTSEKLGGITGTKVGDRSDVHHRLGLAAMNLEAAVLMVRAMQAEVRKFAESGAQPTLKDRIRWRNKPGWAAKTASESMALLFKGGGAHVLWLDDQLNQASRDLIAGCQHYGMQWDNLFIDYGRVAFGMEPFSLMV